MAANKTELLLKTYKTLASISSLTSATLSKNNLVITSIWSQRNLEKGAISKFYKTYINTEIQGKSFIETQPVDASNEILSATSPSEKFTAILRDIENNEGKKQFLEIWQKSNMLRSVDLNSLELHGNVYTDAEFAAFEWSPDESKLLYVAEKKEDKIHPINKRVPSKKNDSGDNKSEKMFEEYKEDWGEQLVGKKSSLLVEYHVGNDEFKILQGIPENICVAQPIWSLDGTYIVGIAYETLPRKLGLIYCSNRRSKIFHLDLKGNYFELNMNNVSVKSPRFTPDGKSLIWLQRGAGGPHHSCMSLVRVRLPIKQDLNIETIIGVVQNVQKINNDRLFYGLYNFSFPKRCFTNDGRLVLSTNQKYSTKSYIVDLESKDITELLYDGGSQIILDVYNDHVLVNRRNILHQDSLFIGKFASVEQANEISWKRVNEVLNNIEGFELLTIKYLDLEHSNSDAVKEFSAIYVGPKEGKKQSVPFIVWVHGGPHSAFGNNLSLETSFYLSLGYSLLLVNFRGSTGAGQSSIDYLLGRIGHIDVEDTLLAIRKVSADFDWLDVERMALIGGSYGGFLAKQLAGKYSDMFRAAVIRNGVSDIASMSIVTDIPDWCTIETGNQEYTQKGQVDNELFKKMRQLSPIDYAHLVKAAVLLQIGLKDLRVPPSQGLDYYHRLKANGVTAKAYVYDDNHPIAKVANEMNMIISAGLWLNEHL